MPETLPADITAAIKNFHSAARREGALGIGTQASAEAEKAASEARSRLERTISAHLRGYAGLKAAMDAITSGAA
ncbi:hypothetical protein ABC766_00250 [Methylobacterium fujisawaense]|jgi:cyclopropane fatty-acyl-phospholipid synthase-like methyltransferase|uniref:hypothetical protein n=1 Tax=Methylobacterium fujisawaense TaxID=107400 RepID=UPI0031F47FCC